MFELSGSFDSLDPEKRRKLADYLEVRNEYLEMTIKLNELRIRTLVEPTAANQDAVNNYASAVLAPMRAKHNELASNLVRDAVNVESLKGMLPMLAMALTSSIDVPLLLTTLNVDPDMIEKIVGEASSFFKRGM
ncbi:MAG TPA: hypothetical protein VFH06_01730 [Candidatus Saccharimonadales bacterium]|nr:hypothetical protein [Candidatus Saccharimonadales bacterium]